MAVKSPKKKDSHVKKNTNADKELMTTNFTGPSWPLIKTVYTWNMRKHINLDFIPPAGTTLEQIEFNVENHGKYGLLFLKYWLPPTFLGVRRFKTNKLKKVTGKKLVRAKEQQELIQALKGANDTEDLFTVMYIKLPFNVEETPSSEPTFQWVNHTSEGMIEINQMHCFLSIELVCKEKPKKAKKVVRAAEYVTGVGCGKEDLDLDEDCFSSDDNNDDMTVS